MQPITCSLISPKVINTLQCLLKRKTLPHSRREVSVIVPSVQTNTSYSDAKHLIILKGKKKELSQSSHNPKLIILTMLYNHHITTIHFQSVPITPANNKYLLFPSQTLQITNLHSESIDFLSMDSSY